MKVVKQIVIYVAIAVAIFVAKDFFKSGGSSKIVDQMVAHVEAGKPVKINLQTAGNPNNGNILTEVVFNDESNYYQKISSTTPQGPVIIEQYCVNGESIIYLNDEDVTDTYTETDIADLKAYALDNYSVIAENVKTAKAASSAAIDSEMTETDTSISITGVDTAGSDYKYELYKDGSKYVYSERTKENTTAEFTVEFSESFELPTK